MHVPNRVVDIVLCGVIFVAPLFMGGRHPVGQLVLLGLVCCAAVVWGAGACWAKDTQWTTLGGAPLILGGLILICLQLVHLPSWMIHRLSPSLPEILPLWLPDGSPHLDLTRWSTITMAPNATRAGLAMFLAYVMLYAMVVQRIRTVGDIHRILRWISLGAILMAFLGIAQQLFGNGRFVWIHEDPFRGSGGVVKGPFINQNHFAHFLVLGLGPMIWWAWNLQSERPRKNRSPVPARLGSALHEVAKPLWVFAIGIVAVACLLTLSRGGIMALLVAVAVCGAAYWLGGLLGKKSIIAFAVTATIVLICMLVHGHEPLVSRLTSAASAGSLDELSAGRASIWKAVLRAVPDFVVLGSGVGSHRYVYGKYYDSYHPVEFTHAESGYLQVLLETGLPGLVLIGWAIALCGYWTVCVVRDLRESSQFAVLGAIVAGIAASAAQSVVDFVWYIPACMSLTMILIACLRRLYQLTVPNAPRPVVIRLPRLYCLLLSALLLTLSVSMIRNQLPAARGAANWHKFQRISQSVEDRGLRPSGELIDERIGCLESLIQANPHHAQAHLHLASLYRGKFEIQQSASELPMPLTHIREAALEADFSSPQQSDKWLETVVGNRRVLLERALRHARRAVQLCPLQGEAYVYLAQLGFLSESNKRVQQLCIEQALRTRPHCAEVQLAAGQEAAMSGNASRALSHYQTAFPYGPVYQRHAIELFGSLGAERFLQTFNMDESALQLLFDYYRRLGLDSDIQLVGIRYAEALGQRARGKSGRQAANIWLRAQAVHQSIGDTARALRDARRAIQALPSDVALRHNLARLLVEQKRYNEATRQLRWCLARRPNSRDLRQELAAASRLAATRPARLD